MFTFRPVVCGVLLLPLLVFSLIRPAMSNGQTSVPPSSGKSVAGVAGGTAWTKPGTEPAAIPDIYGPGAVLSAGRVMMKVTNYGVIGNPFGNLSSDPSGQWPGASGVEYLNYIGLAVAAVNPFATDPAAVRRVSQMTEWRPATLDSVDRIYRTYDGAANGQRFVNDDGDHDPVTGEPRVDEDFLDGRDNDGDGLIDEDHGAAGDQEFTLVMRDDTPEAINAPASEPHVPIGLECRQKAWTYSLQGFSDFNVVDYEIINRSGHTLDSLYLGFSVDMDAGPISKAGYWADDRDLPGYPHGSFPIALATSDPRRQADHGDVPGVPSGAPLCTTVQRRVNGFSTADGDGDGGLTPGIGTFLLVDHTTDPLGLSAPSRVGFRAFRSFTAGTPWGQGGAPTTDAQRYQFMSSTENVDGDGFVNAAPGGVTGDYAQWCSVGPFPFLESGGSLHVTIAFAVQSGSYAASTRYAADYQAYLGHSLRWNDFLARYPVLETALNLMAASDGAYEYRADLRVPDSYGRETGLRAAPGSTFYSSDCRSGNPRAVTANNYTWFDFDCDYCTGPWSHQTGQGYFHHTWSPSSWAVSSVAAAAPPEAGATVAPNPGTGGARIRLAIPEAGTVEVSMSRVAGCARSPADDSPQAGSRPAGTGGTMRVIPCPPESTCIGSGQVHVSSPAAS